VPFPFLSDEWIAAAREIRTRYEHHAPAIDVVVRINQIVTGVPFGEGTIRSHFDTSSGRVEMELGHLENPDLTLTTDYETAKTVFLGRDPQVGMQAFMSGKVKVQGDMTKMMVMQTVIPDDEIGEKVAAELLAITE
jgi:hypothetical protein